MGIIFCFRNKGNICIFDPQVFGEGFHKFVQLEYSLFGVFCPILHLCAAVLLILTSICGNIVRKVFNIYFALSRQFLFGYWGVFGIIYWANIGIPYLAAYVFAPVLLGFIMFNWIRETINPQIDLDFKGIKWHSHGYVGMASRYSFIVLGFYAFILILINKKKAKKA